MESYDIVGCLSQGPPNDRVPTNQSRHWTLVCKQLRAVSTFYIQGSPHKAEFPTRLSNLN